ncbi:MAG TPA: alpha/beta hydrolase [Myxococcota bacterium]|nr:alpha/beta hydrolase [Myxococcota bacterium]
MGDCNGLRFTAALCAFLIAGSGASSDAAAEEVERADVVDVDGAQLFVELRAADAAAPILLWLHGGPGGAERPLFRQFNGDLERDFVVAYLDQRGAGRSFDADADPAKLTIPQHLQDLDRVIDHLRESFGKRRVGLVGHSWGSALGLLYAAEHPEKVSAFVGVAQAVATREAQERELAFLHAEAEQRDDEEALVALKEIGPAPYDDVDEVLSAERLTERYGGLFHRPPNRWSIVLRGLWRGDATPWELYRIIRGNRVSLEAMLAELLTLDLRASVPRVSVPVCMLLGRHDRHADAKLAEEYFLQLAAPKKTLVWFDESAHNVPFEEPERFNAEVRGCLSDSSRR